MKWCSHSGPRSIYYCACNTFFPLSSFVSEECKNSPPDWIPTSVSISVTRTRARAQLAKIQSTMKVICMGFDIILVMSQGLGTMRDLIRIPEKMVHSEVFFKVQTVLYNVEMVVFPSFSTFLWIKILKVDKSNVISYFSSKFCIWWYPLLLYLMTLLKCGFIYANEIYEKLWNITFSSL